MSIQKQIAESAEAIYNRPDGAELSENSGDESQIINDQDLTTKSDVESLDENMGAKSESLDTLEDENAEFMKGEVDVKDQMDRATDAMAHAIFGSDDARDDDELESTYRDTPGGLEEVIQKTDDDLKKHRHLH